MASGSATVTGTASVIVAANSIRHSVIIANPNAATLYIGDSNVTTTNGIPILQNGTFEEDSGGTKLWQGPIYGILATGSVTIPYWERLRA